MATLILNGVLIVVIISVVVLLFYFKIKGVIKEHEEESDYTRDRDKYSIESMKAFIKKQFDEITRMNLYDLALSEEEFNRRKNVKYELKKALKGAGYADKNDKKYVKSLIFDFLRNVYLVNESNINHAIKFSDFTQLTSQDKFDIILYVYQKEFKAEALTEIITRYNLDRPRYEFDDQMASYVITKEDVDEIFDKEITPDILSFEDKLQIVSQRVYQLYKGYSVIDEIRDQNIDGISRWCIWYSTFIYGSN